MSAPFRVALLGFSALERNALQTYFKLAATRQPRYEQVQLLPDADFIVADADHLPSVHLVEAVERLGDAVFVGEEAPRGAAASVRRPLDTMKVLRELDGLATRASGSPPAAEVPGAAAVQPPADGSHGRARTVIQPPRPRKPSTVEAAGELAQSLWSESVPPELPPAAAEARTLPETRPEPPPPPSPRPTPPLRAAPSAQPAPPPAPPGPPATLPEISLRDVSALPARPPVARPAPRAAATPPPAALPPSPPVARQAPPPPAPARAKAPLPVAPQARGTRPGPEMRPVPPPPAPAASRSEPPAAPQARAKPERRALVVDDSDVALHYLQGKLAEFGVGADVAENSQAAQRLLQARDYDFVFLDVELGEASELDGLALCQLIKRQASMRNTVAATVVMVTAHHTELDRVRGTLAGCDAYLGKPLEVVELTRLMASHGLKPAGAKGAKGDRGARP